MDLEHVLLTIDSATDNGWSGDLHAVTGLNQWRRDVTPVYRRTVSCEL